MRTCCHPAIEADAHFKSHSSSLPLFLSLLRDTLLTRWLLACTLPLSPPWYPVPSPQHPQPAVNVRGDDDGADDAKADDDDDFDDGDMDGEGLLDVGVDDVGAGFFGGMGPMSERVVMASFRVS